jgi:predicted amidohydrolase
MRIAAAQSISKPGEISANVEVHVALCRAAAERGVEFIIFPELSLSGYEPCLVARCKLAPADGRLEPLRALAAKTNMVIAVGAPVTSEDNRGLSIGCVTFFPDRSTAIYRKHFLHLGEERFAVAGSSMVQCHRAAGTAVALAICADTAQEEHVVAAKELQAEIYAAGVFWTPGGYANDAAMMRRYATAHGLAVLVANHGGPSRDMAAGGRSAFWAPGGELLGCAREHGQALVIATQVAENWSVETVAIDADSGG